MRRRRRKTDSSLDLSYFRKDGNKLYYRLIPTFFERKTDMKRRNSRIQNRRSIGRIGALLIGTLASALTLAAVTLIISVILYYTSDPTRHIGILTTVALIATGVVCGALIPRLQKEGGRLTALLSSLLLSLILLLVGAIVSGGRVPLYCFINYSAYVAVTALVASVAGRKRRGYR